MNKRGFTLIELLVVIAIIGVLSSVVLSSLNSARQKARDAQRVSNLTEVRTALEMYYHDNGSYPNSGVATWGRTECSLYSDPLVANDVIPGLVPVYISSFPSDPSMDKANSTSCYIYKSTGTDYILLDHDIQDPGFKYFSKPTFVDPRRDGGTNDCTIDGNEASTWSWKVSSLGGLCW